LRYCALRLRDRTRILPLQLKPTCGLLPVDCSRSLSTALAFLNPSGDPQAAREKAVARAR